LAGAAFLALEAGLLCVLASTSATSPTITPDSSLYGDSTVILVFRRFIVATLTLATVLFFLHFRSNLGTPSAKNFCKNNTFTVQ
jgi:hypothetical protein